MGDRVSENFPLVSVGIPTYNREKLLKSTVESVLNQSYKNLEIIISDNGSTDGTESYCRELSQKDPRFTYIRQPINLGSSKNFEYVLHQATGEFFMWLADDDLCEPELIEKLIEKLVEDSTIILSTSDVKLIDAEGSLISIQTIPTLYPENDWLEVRRSLFEFLPRNMEVNFAVYGLGRTEFAKKFFERWSIECYGFTLGWEYPYLAKLATFGKIVAIPQPLKLYRFHEGMGYSEAQRLTPWKNFILRSKLRNRLLAILSESHLSSLEQLPLYGLVICQYGASVFLEGWLGTRNYLIKPIILNILGFLGWQFKKA
ncbi:glycosyltransferase family 2 protein [Kamptonema cortianum]|uniref:Glycosyltransferase family 2 protein n=1 Tax=Geitlerinema calcuttense NRMC-F 0142 TaxID=2922238 RepID=A0ABT7M0U6_9CYAN|nr:glycosyltransferase family 2 protein [Geitlerinema calcuttense]MDK3157458.1 glycosyltransferase family 2 protein [Kamptonema cortianum]MDL5056975.1 glycosyltransferase family 2 protein [Geitlerinema calcuttense NRMC-F 0142]